MAWFLVMEHMNSVIEGIIGGRTWSRNRERDGNRRGISVIIHAITDDVIIVVHGKAELVLVQYSDPLFK